MIDCPYCGCSRFEIEQRPHAGYSDAGLSVRCPECGCTLIEAVARRLDAGLQTDDEQQGLAAFEPDDEGGERE